MYSPGGLCLVCVLRCSVDELKGNDAAVVARTELRVKGCVDRIIHPMSRQQAYPERGGLRLEAGGLEGDACSAEHRLSKEGARGFLPSTHVM